MVEDRREPRALRRLGRLGRLDPHASLALGICPRLLDAQPGVTLGVLAGRDRLEPRHVGRAPRAVLGLGCLPLGRPLGRDSLLLDRAKLVQRRHHRCFLHAVTDTGSPARLQRDAIDAVAEVGELELQVDQRVARGA